MKNHRYHELDAMRAVAAIGVICWHYVNTYHAAPFGHVLAPFYGRGLLMVDFFFVLSGFVLARAFWTDDRRGRLGANIWARVARMYPLHFVALLAVAAMQWHVVYNLGERPFIYDHNDSYHFLLNLTLLNASGLQHGFSFNAPSWSISTEFLINTLFLVVIASPKRWARPIMAAILIAAISTMAVRGVINGQRAFGWFDNDLARTAAGFFMGVLTYRLSAATGDKGKPILWDVSAAALCGVTFWYLSCNRWSTSGDVLTCYAAYPAIIFSVIRSKYFRDLLRISPMVYLGEISYSIYLVHFPILLALHIWSVQTGHAMPGDSRWYFVSFFALVTLTATLTYRLIETPGKRLLLSWLQRKTHTGATGQVTVDGKPG